MKKADLFAYLCIVLLFAALLLFPRSEQEARYVTVYTAEAIYQYPLSKEQTVTVESNGLSLTLVISEETVFVQRSDCPDGVCVNTHPAVRCGDTVLCVPAGVRIEITAKEREIDGTVY